LAREVSKRFFFEKKNQRTFGPAGIVTEIATARSKQKFFGSFFQKRTAFFCFLAFGAMMGFARAQPIRRVYASSRK
jgi:hypothetical protein